MCWAILRLWQTGAEFLMRALGTDAVPEETQLPSSPVFWVFLAKLGMRPQTDVGLLVHGCTVTRIPHVFTFSNLFNIVTAPLVQVALESCSCYGNHFSLSSPSAASSPPRVFSVKNMNLTNRKTGLFGSIVITTGP